MLGVRFAEDRFRSNGIYGLLVFGPTDAEVKGAFENFMAVTGDVEFDVIGIGEAGSRQVVGHILDVDDK